MTNRLVELLADYASYHRTLGNRLTHYVGIPLLTLTISGLLGHVQFGPQWADGWLRLDLGILTWLAVSIWYFSMDWKLALPSSLISLGLYAAGRELPLWLLGIFFVAGWIVQYVGHLKFEHNRPAFHKNLEHLLIGPVWTFGKLLHYLPPLPERPAPQ